MSWRFGNSFHLARGAVFEGLGFRTAANPCELGLIFLDFGPKAGSCVGQGGMGNDAVAGTLSLDGSR